MAAKSTGKDKEQNYVNVTLCIGLAAVSNEQTHIDQTHRPRYFCNSRPHLCNAWMRCGLKVQKLTGVDGICPWRGLCCSECRRHCSIVAVNWCSRRRRRRRRCCCCCRWVRYFVSLRDSFSHVRRTSRAIRCHKTVDNKTAMWAFRLL